MPNSAVVGMLRALLVADTGGFDAPIDKSSGKIADFGKASERAIANVTKALGGEALVRKASAITEAIARMGGAAKLTGEEAARLEPKVSAAIDKLKALGQEVPANLRQTQQALKAIADQADKTNIGATLLHSTFGQLAGALTVSALADRAIGGLFDIGREAFASASRIRDMSTQLGVSTDAIQEWTYAANQAGASFEDISTAVTQMNNRLATGDDSTKAALDEIGLRFKDIRQMRPEDAFNEIAGAIAAMTDPMAQVQASIDLFGKGGPKILAMMKDGMAENIKNAPKLAKSTVEGLAEAEDEWKSFWDHIVVYSGNALVKLKQLKQTDIGIAVQGAGMWSDIISGIAAGKVGDTATRPKVTGPGAALFSLVPGLKDSAAALEQFNEANGSSAEQMSKVQAQIDRNAAAVKALEEAYQKYKRELLTGVTDAHRQELDWQKRMVAEGYGMDLAILKSKNDMASLASAMSGNFDFRKLLAASPLPEDFIKVSQQGGLPLGSAGRALTLAPPPLSTWQSFGKVVSGQLASAANEFPRVLASAILHGQDIAEAMRATVVNLGGDVGSELGKSLAKAGGFATKFGGALSNLLSGGLSSAISIGLDLLMKGLTKLIDHFAGNVTKTAREGLASQLGLGSLAALYDKLGQMGAVGESLRSIGMKIGRNDTAGNTLWMNQVTQFMKDFDASMNKAAAGLAAIGKTAPNALRPLVEDLLKSTSLTDDLRTQLEGLIAKPKWQDLQQQAEDLGVSLDALGSGFQQQKLNDLADGYASFFQQAIDQGGDATGILSGMSDEITTLITQAQKFGLKLPEFMRPMLEQMAKAGLLLDENGNKLEDLSSFSFVNVESSFDRMANYLKEIRDLLAGIGPAATNANNALGAFSALPGRGGGDGRASVMPVPVSMPGFAAGTGGLMNFGSGTPVMLHGWEGVYTAADAAGAAGMMTINLIADGRKFAQVVTPYLPSEVERLGLARG